GFLCKQCKQGILRLIRGKNGSFWGCSNYPSCTATYNDENGRPVLSRY
ncbi:MAG: topoisomerase DNA-binding C4 zinc finger domain-containing protein, partial [Selenomonadales bacterium]|nr:topoisomerase DNA-binding C4 zinc finger domain-containing protein [Selenomonadales bacterium]